MTPSELVGAALREDVGAGDITSSYFIPADLEGTADLVVRQACCLSGLTVAAEAFSQIDPSLEIAFFADDGSAAMPGEVVLTISGSMRSILSAERVALNFVQRLSGIATLTRRFVDTVAGTEAIILDTRKTTPCWRELEKAAVLHGGGQNHRAGLYDMVLVKDNHLATMGNAAALPGIIRGIKSDQPEMLIELEADSLDQVRHFLQIEGVDRILLDNMSLGEMKEAVRMARKHAGSGRAMQLEASGGVRIETVRVIAETGVDFISVGAITHSAPSIDLALDVRAA